MFYFKTLSSQISEPGPGSGSFDSYQSHLIPIQSHSLNRCLLRHYCGPGFKLFFSLTPGYRSFPSSPDLSMLAECSLGFPEPESQDARTLGKDSGQTGMSQGSANIPISYA